MKLSIIIPTFNEESYLPHLLESIKRQDFSDYEVIVADAGSKDSTGDIAHEWGCKVVEGGLPSVGRNQGAEAASGEYLLFLDSDVILTRDYLELCLDEFEKRELGIAITQIAPLSDSFLNKITHDLANFFMKRVENIKPHGAGCYGIITTKKLHNEVEGFDEDLDFGEDTDYIERIGSISQFKVLRSPKLLVSTRRLQEEGLRNVAFKYAKSTFYQFRGKQITAEDLDYTFGHPDQKRILYSVCGEGMGHAIRGRVLLNHLTKNNEVHIFASDRAYDYLAAHFDNVYEIGGFNTVYKDNTVQNTKTFIKGMKDLPGDLKNSLRLMYSVAKAVKPQIIISDFEFYSNLLSKIMRVPLISLDNMHVLTQAELEVPRKYRTDRIAAEGVVRSFIQLPTVYLITSYFYPPLKNSSKTKYFPPVLRDTIMELEPYNGEHVLVYQTSASNVRLLDILKEFDDEFIVYGFHRDERDGNLLFKSFNEDEFFNDLAQARAVISNGGFTLISEALYLGKPVLSVPVKKQFEQILNALYMDRLGYGEFHEDLDRDDIENFLSKLEEYRKNIRLGFAHDHNQSIMDELDFLIDKYAK
ncbi:MJ1255/VC2487 family glycosyltransferase [Methanobacterium sp.]|uniref:MJ1255/VC2487 family glycosyltransferase n=1 Tax=Methanobacterium sp. TaxID=2164 RepID=UPI002AB85734|nr:MJ1255/VC2487 family glycosyltransferase [Methanobacterium sp.]MDY9922532.1 MJ1255/VC2487 family glycosyltransferase [Methanobacterium sp.]